MPERFEETVAEVSNLADPVLRNDPDLVRWEPSAGEWERREWAHQRTATVLQPGQYGPVQTGQTLDSKPPETP
jgi:hypothetical protein